MSPGTPSTPLALALAILLCRHEGHYPVPATSPVRHCATCRCCQGCFARAMAIYPAVDEMVSTAIGAGALALRDQYHMTDDVRLSAEGYATALGTVQVCTDELVADALAVDALLGGSGGERT